MPQMSMSLDITKAVEALTDLEKTQLPYAVARVLTECAASAQHSVQKVVSPGSSFPFTIRNAWTSKSIGLRRAEKGTLPLQAAVIADTTNEHGGNYLALQDAGGEKVPHNGHEHIAVPSDKLIQMVGKGNIIPAELRAKNLIAEAAHSGKYVKTLRSGKRKDEKVLASQKIVRGFVFFLQKAGGVDAIMGRYITDRQAYVFYWLVPEARIKAIFPFERLCETAIKEGWVTIWERVWNTIRVKGIKF